jgi:3-phenylpropionate/cinnamic acid dioxygenase small subunit
MYAGYDMKAPDARTVRELRLEIEEFHTEYCNVLDRRALDEWVEFFAEDALYRVTARENADAGLRVGLVYAEGRGMIRDRAFAIQHTQMFAPRYMQHFTSNVRVVAVEGPDAGAGEGSLIKAQANYLLLQTLVDGPTTIHQSGRYYDTFVRKGNRLLIRERQCVYDTLLIANDLVYPV